MRAPRKLPPVSAGAFFNTPYFEASRGEGYRSAELQRIFRNFEHSFGNFDFAQYKQAPFDKLRASRTGFH